VKFSTRAGALLVALLTATSVQLAVMPSVAHAVGPILKVMPLGDSITDGARSSSNAGYRLPLWNLAVGSTAYTLDFVGARRSGALPDADNEGHSGFMIDDLRPVVQAGLATAAPDIVLLHVGINDLDRGDVVGAPDRLANLVDLIFDIRPDVVIVLAGLVGVTAGLEAEVQAFNRRALLLQERARQSGHTLRYVDLPLVPAEMADRLHPNDAGYDRIAAVFAEAVDDTVSTRQVRPKPWTDTKPPEESQFRWSDINGDTRADIAVLDERGTVRTFNNVPDGWRYRGEIATGVTTDRNRVRFADFDGDARDDYLVFDDSGAVRAYLNRGGDGAGGWLSRGTVATGVTTDRSRVRFADFDGDARDDYLVTSAADNRIGAYLNRGGDGAGGWWDAGDVVPGSTS
jgi:lysophospholipase L1-like esterase